MSDSEQEYEVESVTRARVHDKRGKKLTWKYHVKWKGYGWDECTWEPVEHFTKEAIKIIDDFWKRVDTGGRDIHDGTHFKKGEEMFISGPPGKKVLKRKQSAAMIQHSPPVQETSVPTVDNTISTRTTPRKRRKVQKPYDDILHDVQLKRQVQIPRPRRRISTATQKGKAESTQNKKRRRASSPGPRRIVSRRLPSVTDSELDAEGEIDPDIEMETREVEDALVQSSVEDGDEHLRKESQRNSSGSQDIPTFDDIEHFYSGQPIDIARASSEDMQVTSMVSVPETSISQKLDSPTSSSPHPLFDSPPHSKSDNRERSEESSVPFHRIREANPLVKVMEAPVPKTSATAITAKARLMSMPAASTSGAGPVRATAKRGRGGAPGPVRLSSNLLTKTRSSLLTASKGKLKTVKGTFAPTNTARHQPEEIEEVPSAWDTGDSALAITSWSDGDAVGETDHEDLLRTSADPKPSGSELPKLAGTEKDATLPDFEEDPPAQEKSVEPSEGQPMVEAKQEESAPSVDITADQDAQASSTLAAARDTITTTDSSAQPDTETISTNIATPSAEDIVKRNLALAKEQLFPSASPQKASFPLFSDASASFTSTIFGPLYQGTSNHTSSSGVNEIGCSTSFKITMNDTISIPLTLEDITHMHGRMSDLRIGKSANGRAGNFYGENDALAIVNTLRSCGTARVVPDVSADSEQRERFAGLLHHFESNRTFVSAVGMDVYVLYSSENIAVAEKLSTPGHLIGLGGTLLVSRASIENQSTYAQAAYAAHSVLS